MQIFQPQPLEVLWWHQLWAASRWWLKRSEVSKHPEPHLWPWMPRDQTGQLQSLPLPDGVHPLRVALLLNVACVTGVDDPNVWRSCIREEMKKWYSSVCRIIWGRIINQPHCRKLSWREIKSLPHETDAFSQIKFKVRHCNLSRCSSRCNLHYTSCSVCRRILDLHFQAISQTKIPSSKHYLIVHLEDA